MTIDITPYQRFDLSQIDLEQRPDRPPLRPFQVIRAVVAVLWTGSAALSVAYVSVSAKAVFCMMQSPCAGPGETQITILRGLAVALLLATGGVAWQRLHRWWAWLAPIVVGPIGVAVYFGFHLSTLPIPTLQ